MKNHGQRVPWVVCIMTENFSILHLALSIYSFLDATPWFPCSLDSFPSLLFYQPLFQPLFGSSAHRCFMLRSSRTQDYSCCSVTPWFSASVEEVLSCIYFFLVEIIPLFWTVWMWSLTHSMLLGVQGPSVGSVWSPTCHKPPPSPVCAAVGEARQAERVTC